MLNFPEGGSRLPDGLVLEPLDDAGVDSKFDLTLYAAEDADAVHGEAIGAVRGRHRASGHFREPGRSAQSQNGARAHRALSMSSNSTVGAD